MLPDHWIRIRTVATSAIDKNSNVNVYFDSELLSKSDLRCLG